MLITFLPYTVSRDRTVGGVTRTDLYLLMLTVLADGDLPRERAGDFAFLWLRDGDRRHPGEAAAVFLSRLPLTPLVILQRVSPPVGDRGVRLQPPLPAERADPNLGEPDLLQTPHPQSHHAGPAHVLHRECLLLHLLPASW